MTNDMKTHKNPALRLTTAQPYKPSAAAQVSAKTVKSFGSGGDSKPPKPAKCALEGKKWVVVRALISSSCKQSPVKVACMCVIVFTQDLREVMLCCVVLCCVALRCVALRCVALRCVALRCVALRCVALRCVACGAVRYGTVRLRYVTLRYVIIWYLP